MAPQFLVALDLPDTANFAEINAAKPTIVQAVGAGEFLPSEGTANAGRRTNIDVVGLVYGSTARPCSQHTDVVVRASNCAIGPHPAFENPAGRVTDAIAWPVVRWPRDVEGPDFAEGAST